MMRKVWAMVAAMVSAGAAMAHEPIFDPRAHRVFAGPPSEVLVLGTPHLSGLPKAFKPEDLSLLLDRLAAWKPQIITIEGISGPECELFNRYKAIYADTFDNYCWDLAPAEKATGLDAVAATVEAKKLLDHWPAAPTAAERRHLAAVFVAAGDRASALVQWLRLPGAERHEGDGLNGDLVAILKKGEASRNENYAIAAALAARLGLERVFPVDDHTADAALTDAGKDYEEAVQKAWANPVSKARKAEMEAIEAKLGTPEGTLAVYRFHNGAKAANYAFNGDFGAALKDPSPSHFGRQYAAWWETRNLRMVANIRATLIIHPGSRVLSVVGSSHKGYFEAYLGMMHDVRLADAEAVLK